MPVPVVMDAKRGLEYGVCRQVEVVLNDWLLMLYVELLARILEMSGTGQT